MKLFDRLYRIVFPDSQDITEEVILHYEKNPDELDLIINKDYFNTVYLGLVFLMGLLLTVGARLISYFYGNALGKFVNTVLLDLLSEIGIALFGGAVAAYLIEFLNKKQFQQNIKFRRAVKRIIDQRNTNPS